MLINMQYINHIMIIINIIFLIINFIIIKNQYKKFIELSKLIKKIIDFNSKNELNNKYFTTEEVLSIIKVGGFV